MHLQHEPLTRYWRFRKSCCIQNEDESVMVKASVGRLESYGGMEGQRAEESNILKKTKKQKRMHLHQERPCD